MKELDLLLEGWFRDQFRRASPSEQARFASLLELPDPELARYLLGRERPPSPELTSAAAAVLANAGVMSRCCEAEPLPSRAL